MNIAVVYVWAIDGIEVLFATDEVLDDAYAVAQGFISVQHGLHPPQGLKEAIDLRELIPEATDAQLVVEDLDDTLPELFAGDPYDYEPLVFTLEPTDVPVAELFGKYVGMERIGPAGERHRFSCIPGFSVGFKHLGNNEAFANDVGPTPVSDHPVLWEGRRCAVYRVKLVGGAWQDLADAKRVWSGTLRADGDLEGRTWAFDCFGPESWMGGNLGRGRYQTPQRVLPLFSLEPAETVMRADLWLRDIAELQEEYIKYTYVDRITSTDANNGLNDDAYLEGATTYEDVVAAFQLFFDDIVDSTQNVDSLAFNRNDKNDIYYETANGADGVTLRWKRSDDDRVAGGDIETTTAEMRMTAHGKVWRALGYDPELEVPSPFTFVPADQIVGFGEGYYDATFTAATPTAMDQVLNGEPTPNVGLYTNEGSPRRWPPVYQGGAVAFSGETRQEFRLMSIDPLLISGSKSRPLMASADDESVPYSISDGVGDVTHQGLMVFEGPYRRADDDDKVDPVAGYAFEIERERREGRTVQLARVCWRASADGAIAVDLGGWPRLVVYRWYDPRDFGFDFKPIDGQWGGFRKVQPDVGTIVGRPLAAWEYSDQGDKAMTVLRRIMLTTGTAGAWYTDDTFATEVFGLSAGGIVQQPGVNDDGGPVVADAEDAYLGLRIPSSMVAAPAVFAAASSNVGNNLKRCKVASVEVASSERTIARLLAPMGVAIGYAGGVFTPFDVARFPSPYDATTITPESLGGDPEGTPISAVPRQRLRKWQALDKIVVNARIEPTSGDYHERRERTSTDVGSTSRAQQVVQQVDGAWLLDPSVELAGADWDAELIPRWRQLFNFWAAPHTRIAPRLHALEAEDIHAGDAVLYSDPWAINRSGEYGVSVAVGRVLSRTWDADDEVADFEILLAAESDFKMWAPAAIATRYDEDDEAQGFRLLCLDDMYGDRSDGSFDVDGFEEPPWSTEGDLADIEIFQFDGAPDGPNQATGGWTRGIFGVVESIHAEVGNSFLKLTGALTGQTYFRDMHHIVVFAQWSVQSSVWVKRWFAPITDSDGTHSGGTKGAKWRGL